MRKKASCFILVLSMAATAAWGDAGPVNPDNRLKQLEQKASELKSGKTPEYAPEALKEALSAVSSAQAAVAGGNQKLAQQKIEMSTLLLAVAEAKATERELLEKVAVQRVELKKLEAQLERNLSGEEKP